MSTNITISRDQGIMRIVMNRPEKKNALTMAMYAAMADAFGEARGSDDIRVLVIEGSDGCFSAGNDLRDFLEQPPDDQNAPVLRFLRELVHCEVPLVAAVDGDAVGIGTTMLLHCDFVLATPRARLHLPFVNLGLLPEAGSTYLLPRLVGHARAAELLMLGEPFDGARARDLGIVNVLCEPGALSGEAMALAGKLAAKPVQALRATKALLLQDRDAIRRHVDLELARFQELLQTRECKAALKAFLDRGGA